MKNVVKTDELTKELQDISYQVRRNLVELASRKTIHIGGALSCCDILTVLWQSVIDYDYDNPGWEYRDRFFLSKGHCQAAVAFNMAYAGAFDVEDVMKEYGNDNTRFSMAPCKHTNSYYESSATGSLGQGIPIGCGVALALKTKHNLKSKVIILAGDGEIQEGSNWEAIMYAGQKKLDNVIVIIDNNSLQFDGYTKDIVDVESINKRFESFGWDAYDLDGHNISSILDLFSAISGSERPVVVNAHTVKGKGVPYMENNYKWHAGRINTEDLNETLHNLDEVHRGCSHV